MGSARNFAANATIYTVDLADRYAPKAETIAGSSALDFFATRSGGRYLQTRTTRRACASRPAVSETTAVSSRLPLPRADQLSV